MQATNKNDATQVLESTEKATKLGVKDSFKYLLTPLTIFSYHYFIEGIKSVQRDGPTKELEKITNLSYEETVEIMQRCQRDGIRVVASERKLSDKDSEFGKRKSLFQQKRITRYTRKIRNMSNFKAHFPKIGNFLQINKFINKNEQKQKKQIESHKTKRYNIYFNKSKQGYMSDRIRDLIEYRTKISKDLFDNDMQEVLEKSKEEGMILNAQQLRDLSNKFKLYDMGNVEIDKFKQDYCIHEISFSTFLSIKDELEVADIPYGIKIIENKDEEKIANIYFENKHLERYNELEFDRYGQMYVYGNNSKDFPWSMQSQEKLISFKSKTGNEEKQIYSTLSGKNYIMKREENECFWTVSKADLKEVIEKEKKRNVVSEELEKYNIFEKLGEQIENSPTVPENKSIKINMLEEKEVDN